MSLYTDIRDGVIVWTNRPDLVAETDAAIRQALRSAHRAALFWRDLETVPLTLQPLDQVQQIDLTAAAPGFKQMAYVKPTGLDLHYNPVDIGDLFDDYKSYKTDVYYGMGNYLMIRAASPVADITLSYYKYPLTSPIASISSWIAEFHQDLVILWAAATILAFVGEQEIKARVDMLAKIAFDDLISDGLKINGT